MGQLLSEASEPQFGHLIRVYRGLKTQVRLPSAKAWKKSASATQAGQAFRPVPPSFLKRKGCLSVD